MSSLLTRTKRQESSKGVISYNILYIDTSTFLEGAWKGFRVSNYILRRYNWSPTDKNDRNKHVDFTKQRQKSKLDQVLQILTEEKQLVVKLERS